MLSALVSLFAKKEEAPKPKRVRMPEVVPHVWCTSRLVDDDVFCLSCDQYQGDHSVSCPGPGGCYR